MRQSLWQRCPHHSNVFIIGFECYCRRVIWEGTDISLTLKHPIYIFPISFCKPILWRLRRLGRRWPSRWTFLDADPVFRIRSQNQRRDPHSFFGGRIIPHSQKIEWWSHGNPGSPNFTIILTSIVADQWLFYPKLIARNHQMVSGSLALLSYCSFTVIC